MLSSEEVAHYRSFGFVVIREVLTQDELSKCDVELERALNFGYAHKPFDGSKKQVTTAMGPETPFMASLLEDSRMLLVARALGGDVLSLIADVNRRVGDTLWHPDADANHPCGVKFAWMLESVGKNSGALRLIPGSHLQPYHDHLRELLFPFPPIGERPKIPIASVPAHACAVEAGDVVVFDPRTWHSSVGGGTGRKLCTLFYLIDPKTPEQEAWAREHAMAVAQIPSDHDRAGQVWYPPEWIRNESRSGVRQRWIERLCELGYYQQLERTSV